MARIGTVGIGRIGAVGDCLIADQSMGLCPDGSPYFGTLDSGGAALDLSTLPNYAAEATAAGLGVPPAPSAPTVSSLPLNLPSLFAPKGVVAAPTGLSVPITCPTGFISSGGVCVTTAPASTTLIPGVPNWALYGGAGLLLLVAMMSASSGGRGKR